MNPNPHCFNATSHGLKPEAEKPTALQRRERANSESCVAATLFVSASGFNPWLLLLSLAFCLLPCAVRADPIIGPAVEQNGLRFESWLASSQIAIPDKNLKERLGSNSKLFSIRVTNLTPSPLRLSPYSLSTTLIGPGGKELFADMILIAGYVREPQESDYVVLQPGQSLIMPYFSFFYWRDDHLCLSLPSSINGYPFVYEGSLVDADKDRYATTAKKLRRLMTSKHQGLTSGNYQFSIHYSVSSPTVAIRDDHTAKIIKTLNGFWTGDVTLPPVRFELTEPTPARSSPPLPKREG